MVLCFGGLPLTTSSPGSRLGDPYLHEETTLGRIVGNSNHWGTRKQDCVQERLKCVAAALILQGV